MTFQKSFLKSVKTKVRKKSKIPQIKITNPLKKDIYVNAIELTLDSHFNVKGIAEVLIDGNVVLDSVDVGDFRKYRLFQIPLNDKTLSRRKSIEIFVWNGLDDDYVELSANISISEKSDAIALSGIPADPDQINRHVSATAGGSSSSALFEHKTRYNETETALLNMDGNRNLIVTMSGSLVVAPTVDCDD